MIAIRLVLDLGSEWTDCISLVCRSPRRLAGPCSGPPSALRKRRIEAVRKRSHSSVPPYSYHASGSRPRGRGRTASQAPPPSPQRVRDPPRGRARLAGCSGARCGARSRRALLGLCGQSERCLRAARERGEPWHGLPGILTLWLILQVVYAAVSYWYIPKS